MKLKLGSTDVYFMRHDPLHYPHGPQTWPWWRLVSPSLVTIDVPLPSWGLRLYVYTRWGSPCFDIFVDRGYGMYVPPKARPVMPPDRRS